MKTLTHLLLVSVMAITAFPLNLRADGTFVEPKLVWDKHKDINEPTQKAIIVYDSGREDLILQVKYEGPVDQFGWLIPAPNRPTVREGSMKCFYELSRFTQQKQLDRQWAFSRRGAYGAIERSDADSSAVKVVETKTVGDYGIAVLSANNSDALKKWLSANQFYIPPDKSGIIDSYLRQNYYFVAVKISLSWLPFTISTSTKLASGELNPLQISFDSSRCVFPLRISSINGRPSEVQVYVLAQEPLLEQAMFERQLPMIYSNDMARADARAQFFEKRELEMKKRREAFGAPPPLQTPNGDLSQELRQPEVSPDEWLEIYKAADGDLAACTRAIGRLAGKPWWVTKDTWIFAPDEMRDLDFGPAISILAETLASKDGYVASQNLALIGDDAVPVLIAEVRSPNHDARLNAATALDNTVFYSDPQVKEAAISWLKSPEPKARLTAIDVLTWPSNVTKNTIVMLTSLLDDDDAGVRDLACYAIAHLPNVQEYASTFNKMLTDKNIDGRIAALRVIFTASLPISHNQLFPFFKIPNQRAVAMATAYFRTEGNRYDLSEDQALPLLQNTEPLARIIALHVLEQNADRRAIELAQPLLKDPNPTVQHFAVRVMRQMEEPDSSGPGLN